MHLQGNKLELNFEEKKNCISWQCFLHSFSYLFNIVVKLH